MQQQISSLQDLFVEQISDLYSAEQQIIDALPKMASRATSDDLRKAFEMHLDQTQNHVRRLEQVCDQLNLQRKNEMCKGMQGLIKEGNELMQKVEPGPVCDAAMIAAAQRIEHYEIAGYGCVKTYANELGYDDAKDILQQTEDEEGQTDQKLTDLATGGLLSSGINVKAE